MGPELNPEGQDEEIFVRFDYIEMIIDYYRKINPGSLVTQPQVCINNHPFLHFCLSSSIMKSFLLTIMNLFCPK